MSRLVVPRAAAYAWSPLSDGADPQWIATGLASGALDAEFSQDAELNIWEPFGPTDELGQLGIRASVKTTARFNRVAWGYVHADRPKGVIATSMENGEVHLLDPVKMLDGSDFAGSTIHSHALHTGPVRGLDFNLVNRSLLASGATHGEIYCYDVTNPSKPYSPANRSRNLEDITALQWNGQVAHILAASSTSGYTVVFDLKNKREVVSLSYAGAAPAMGQQAPWMGQPGAGGRRSPVSAVAWHPDNPTKLATASDDDINPIIALWDLRNAMTPERILTGHNKGVLSLSWSSSDADLLYSCGKDCRTIAWNPSTGESVGELPASSNWTFQTSPCPRNPGLVATASFDGQIVINSVQATLPQAEVQAALPSGADLFEAGNLNASQQPTVSLKQAPKWLGARSSVSFGFGGKLVSVGKSSAGPSTVRVAPVVSEPSVVERALRLETATESNELGPFCEQRKALGGADADGWGLLGTLFRADSRDELVSLLGFSKDDVRARVDEAIKAAVKSNTRSAAISRSASTTLGGGGGGDNDDAVSVAREPLVTFAAETEGALSGSSEGEAAAVPASSVSESGASTQASDATKVAPTEAETEVTEPSLFGDDAAPAQQAAADFYSSIRSGRPAALPDHVRNQFNVAPGSSVGATVGSRASSVASDTLRPTTFRIYPEHESDADRLITRALVLGDFASAVTLCLSADRFADALLLAVRGGPELLARTQKAYFERRTTSLPYLRVFQSIVLDDLDDVVQNADLHEWQEVFVVLCTFAKADEFGRLVEQLGTRLEYQSTLNGTTDLELRKHAVLCYLAAGKLEKVVGIWIDEMREQERRETDESVAASAYSAHASALQTLVEKVTVFKSAVRYVDADLADPTDSRAVAESGARTYKLARLYDCYRDYADVLAAQGLVTPALKYVAQTPADYRAAATSVKSRLEVASGTRAPAPRVAAVAPTAAVPVPSAPVAAPAAPASSSYTPYGAPAMPAAPVGYNPYAAPQPPAGPYGQPAQPSYGAPYAQPSFMPPPPPPVTSSAAPPPPPSARNVGGWNDAPSQAPPKRTPSAAAASRPGAIVSPFPNQAPMHPPPSPSLYGGPQIGQPPSQPGPPPPPSRGATRTPHQQGYVPPAPQMSPPRPPSAAQMGRPGPPPVGQPPRGPPQFSGPPPSGPPPRGPPTQPPPSRPPVGNPLYGPGPPQQPPPPPQQRGPPGPPPIGPGAPVYRPPQPPSGPAAPSAYAPSPSMNGMRSPPPPQQAPPKPVAPPKPEPAKPKFPPGDRTHIPDASRPAYEILNAKMQRFKQLCPPQQKKMADDTERRLNLLFDALNCETLSKPTLDRILDLARAIDAQDQNAALQIHLHLLTNAGADDIAGFMPALKQLANRCLDL